MYLCVNRDFPSFLTAVAWCMRRGLVPDGFLHPAECPLVAEAVCVEAESDIVDRFEQALTKAISAQAAHRILERVWHAWLSEIPGLYPDMFHYLNQALRQAADPSQWLDLPYVKAVVSAAGRCARLSHAWLGLLRFQTKSIDGQAIFVAEFAPDCNILPLISSHFADRYADQDFAIVDKRRGLVLQHVRYGPCRLMKLQDSKSDESLRSLHLTRQPQNFCSDDMISRMWVQYLKHLTIPERVNQSLQNSNLPRKHRRWLTEFQSSIIETGHD